VKHSPSENSCAVKMNRLSAAGCQDIVSFGNQLDLDCVFIGPVFSKYIATVTYKELMSIPCLNNINIYNLIKSNSLYKLCETQP
jgi:hypothetical protein